ncbi:MAG: DUF2062 domain-containing protein [Candidatus Altiarchaeota archaeon]
MMRGVKLNQRLKDFFDRTLRAKRSPHSIALGFAIGSFIAIMPTPGFGTLLGLLVVLLYKKVNKLSVFLGLAFWNPLTLVPLYILSYKIGDMLLAPVPVVDYDIGVMYAGYHLTRRFLLGNLILSTLLSTVSYAAVRLYVESQQKKL